MQKAPPTPKGFRDIKPDLAKKRREVINKIIGVLEESGFVPIETPIVEFAETLLGKYGEEERLIYQFKDRGGRKLALRYDLTVPLARYVATYNPPLPFRRYQIGQVFRGEKPQRGRWREFTQLDFDTVGSGDIGEDAKIIATAIKAYRLIGLSAAVMFINDRANLADFPAEVVRAIDKLYKINEKGVAKELSSIYPEEKTKDIISSIKNKKPTTNLLSLFSILKNDYQLGEEKDFVFDPTLARGLDYYTGSIFELRTPAYENLSIGSGGRYDNLIGMFSKKDIPAVGFSFGIDRLIELL